jgi:hypothetical protein
VRGLFLKGVVVAAVFAGASESAVSQVPTQNNPYPINDISVTLSSGTVVRIRDIVIFQSQNGSSGLTLYFQTPTPPTEVDRVASEAKEVAGFQVKSPTREKISTVSVGVCRTQACLEMRERPKEMFFFVRQPDGSWKPEKVLDPL